MDLICPYSKGRSTIRAMTGTPTTASPEKWLLTHSRLPEGASMQWPAAAGVHGGRWFRGSVWRSTPHSRILIALWYPGPRRLPVRDRFSSARSGACNSSSSQLDPSKGSVTQGAQPASLAASRTAFLAASRRVLCLGEALR